VPESNAALATIVYRLREQLNSLQTVVNGLTTGEAGHSHPDLTEALTALAQLVQAHVDAEEERLTRESAPVWAGITDEEHAEQLAKLRPFVDQLLRVAYTEQTRTILLDCWANHPAALWELGNLHAEWNRVYKRKRPLLDGALVWHDRWLPGVVARLKDVMQGCRAGDCSARPRPRSGP
jgi:hypothetical protein